MVNKLINGTIGIAFWLIVAVSVVAAVLVTVLILWLMK